MNKSFSIFALPLALLAVTGAQAAPIPAGDQAATATEQARGVADGRDSQRRTQVARAGNSSAQLNDADFARDLRRSLPPPQPRVLDPNLGAGTGTLGSSGGPGGSSGPR